MGKIIMMGAVAAVALALVVIVIKIIAGAIGLISSFFNMNTSRGFSMLCRRIGLFDGSEKTGIVPKMKRFSRNSIDNEHVF